MPTGRASDTTHDKPLSDECRKILNRVKYCLVKDMDAEEVLLKMAAENVFTTTEEDKIKAKPTRSEKNGQLLEILPTKGTKAYEIFKKVLQEVHQHLANIILERENTELRSNENSGQSDRARQETDSIENELRKEVVTFQRCLSILEEAGNCWKELGAELQISESKLRNIETDHQRARDKASAVLEKWRDIKGRDATVGCLLDAFERSGQKRIADNLLELWRAEL
ncbi:THO complex subunit 1-like [Pocillopora verrucosa]|uniref:THO complex subunit 1-like n=1 Tax=Pocillopora verrucosa TaxID=203993 RepID=UPI0033424977